MKRVNRLLIRAALAVAVLLCSVPFALLSPTAFAADNAPVWVLEKKIPATYGGGLELCGASHFVLMSNIGEIIDTVSGKITKLPKEFNWGGPISCSPDGQFIFGLGREEKPRRKWIAYRIDSDEKLELPIDQSVRLSKDGKSGIAWTNRGDVIAPWGTIKIYNAPGFPNVILPWFEVRQIALGLKFEKPSYIPQHVPATILDLQTGQVCVLDALDANSSTVGRDTLFFHNWNKKVNADYEDVDAVTIANCKASEKVRVASRVGCFSGFTPNEYAYCAQQSLYVKSENRPPQKLLSGKHFSYDPQYSADGQKIFVQVTQDTHPNEPYDPENEPILPVWIYVYGRASK